MKKLLLLGGSFQQIPAIKAAQKAGYETVLCDYLPDNPGQYVADHFYCVSTTDHEAILHVAEREKIDGIVAYASDPAALTAAYVAETLHLPTNPYASVKILSEKHLFRNFLRENGFAAPRSADFTTCDEAFFRFAKTCHFPVMIKPVDSSGSKGVSCVKEESQLQAAFNHALLFSRSGTVIIEEYIEKSHPYMVGGDIFVVNGKVEFWGLLNCHRDESGNNLVPTGKSYPLVLSPSRLARIHVETQKLIDLLKIENGAFNVELVFDSNDVLYFMEMGPRNGGNMIPELLSLISGIDLVQATVESAMGSLHHHLYFNGSSGCYATYNIHSKRAGKLQGISFAPQLQPYIIRKTMYKKMGDEVEYFNRANQLIGILFMKFPSQECMMDMLHNMNDYVKVDVDVNVKCRTKNGEGERV